MIKMLLTQKALVCVALSTLNIDKDTSDCRAKHSFSSHFGCSVDLIYQLLDT